MEQTPSLTTPDFDAAEQDRWLQLRATKMMLSRLQQKRLEKLEAAARQSRVSSVNETQLRQLLNEAVALEDTLKFLTTVPKTSKES